jgi:hypothetical protein
VEFLFSSEAIAEAAAGVLAEVLSAFCQFFFRGCGAQTHSSEALGAAKSVVLQPQGFFDGHALPAKYAIVGCTVPTSYFYFFNHLSQPLLRRVIVLFRRRSFCRV